MKKLILSLSCLLCSGLMAFAQNADPSVNIMPDDPSIPQNTTTLLRATAGNAGNNTIVANSMRLTITVGSNAEILGVAAGSDPRWTVQSLTTGTGNTIRLTNNATFTAIDVNDVVVTVRGNVVGSGASIGSNIVYIAGTNPLLGGATNASQGNGQTLNDNSSTSLSVTAPLPVDMKSFTARRVGSTALLQWTTASEQNTDRFNVLRSDDAKHWVQIGQVQASGTSSVEHSYELTDSQPLSGTNHYKLEIVDRNGARSESDVRRVDFGGKSSGLSYYPVPVKDVLHIAGIGSASVVLVYDAAGRIVRQVATAGNALVEVDLSAVPAGLYQVVVTSGPDRTGSMSITKQ